VKYDGPQAAIAHGVGMLQQDPLDVGAFNVLENFTYGGGGGFFLNKRRIHQQFQDVCQRLRFELDPESPIEQLTVAQRQQLEIVRLLAKGINTLILDEPTTGISADQKDLLFDTLRSLARTDGMIVLLVSHKLEDVIALCDEIVVLRTGKLVGALDMPAEKSDLVNLMFGQELVIQPRERKNFTDAPLALELRDVSLRGKRLTMDGVNLQARRGEVIGLAGLDGSGQGLLMRACAGLTKIHSGQVLVNGLNMTGKPYRRYMQAGVIFGAAGRLEEGLIAGLTLTEHIALAHENNVVIDWNRARQRADHQIQRFNVRGGPQNRIEELSGGTQQRVLMGLLPDQSTALVLEQPTRGLDVDSAQWIWEQLLLQREQGSAIIFSSPDLDELALYSDRIIVCYSGRTYVVDDPGVVTVSELGHLIGGEFGA
jgi:simple sugar transport system ATP-binding protein